MVQTAQELAGTEEHVYFVSSCQDDKMDIVKHRAQIRITGKTKKKNKGCSCHVDFLELLLDESQVIVQPTQGSLFIRHKYEFWGIIRWL